MSKLIFMGALVVLCWIGAASAATLKRPFATCISYSLNSFRSFFTDGFFESSCRTGSTLIFKNKWLQVVSHTQFNTSTKEFDLKSNKLYLEFYDKTGLPVAQLSSDAFTYIQNGKKANNIPSLNQMMEFGLNGALRVNFQTDSNGFHSSYIIYPAANMRVYFRRAHHGFNFGIQVADISDATGLCVTGARLFDKEQFQWLINSNMALARQTCDTVFNSFRLIDNQLKSELKRACVEDVAASQHTHLAFDYRNSFIDQLFFAYDDFTQFIKDIKSTFGTLSLNEASVFSQKNFSAATSFFQQNGCQNVDSGQFNTDNDESVSDTSKKIEKDEIKSEQQDKDLKIKSNKKDDFDRLCRTKSPDETTDKVFFFPHPDSSKMFIQCDEFGRAFVRDCLSDTLFIPESKVCVSIQ